MAVAPEMHIHIHQHIKGAKKHFRRIMARLDILQTTVETQGESMAVDLSGLQNAIATLAADAENESTEVGAKLTTLQRTIDEQTALIEELRAGQVTQEQIDALTANAQTVSQTIQSISEAADPETPTPVEEPPTEPV